jgi:hypothetical protein
VGVLTGRLTLLVGTRRIRKTKKTTVKKVIPTTRHRPVLLVASQLPGVFVAAVEAALPGIVVVSGPVVISATAAAVPTILAAATRPDRLHVAARLPGVAVAAEASAARSVII